MTSFHPESPVPSEVQWARGVIAAFALVGLMHVPAFYAMLYVELTRPSPPVIEACPAPKPVQLR